MSGCGCTGHYHDGGCSDQNVVYWLGADGRLPACGIPVNPTPEEIAAQDTIVNKRLRLPDAGVRILTPAELAR
jgi:uracil-DNA glycosylase